MDLLMRLIVMALLGFLFAYGEPVTQLSLLVALWRAACQPQAKLLSLFIFFAIAMSPAALAAFDYNATISLALLAWAVPVALNVIALGCALSVNRHAALCTVLVLTGLSLLPLSGYAVISIWPLAGLLFPGTGWVGIGLITVLMFLLIACSSRHRRVLNTTAMSVMTMLVLSTNAHAAVSSTTVAKHIVGIDTYRGMPDKTTQALFAQAWRHAEHDEAARQIGATVVFPESTFGDYHEPSRRILAGSSPTIIGGARQWLDENHYVNVLIDASDGRIIYRQRVPVPWLLGGTTQAVPAASISESAIAALLCVELVNTGLVAQTYASARSEVIWAANLGWSYRRALHRRLIDETVLWSRLFDVPTIAAINYPEDADA